jgi:hypothetical protein
MRAVGDVQPLEMSVTDVRQPDVGDLIAVVKVQFPETGAYSNDVRQVGVGDLRAILKSEAGDRSASTMRPCAGDLAVT